MQAGLSTGPHNPGQNSQITDCSGQKLERQHAMSVDLLAFLRISFYLQMSHSAVTNPEIGMRISSMIRHWFLPLSLGLCLAGTLHAAGEVSSVETSDRLGTPFRYTVDGTAYTWGLGRNQILERITVAGESYGFIGEADRVEVRRDDVPGVSTGVPCGLFVERLAGSAEQLQANYPVDSSDSGNCDMAAMLASRTVNRGTLDTFFEQAAHAQEY